MSHSKPTAFVFAGLALVSPALEEIVAAECKDINNTLVCRQEAPPPKDHHGRESVSQDAMAQTTAFDSGPALNASPGFVPVRQESWDWFDNDGDDETHQIVQQIGRQRRTAVATILASRAALTTSG